MLVQHCWLNRWILDLALNTRPMHRDTDRILSESTCKIRFEFSKSHACRKSDGLRGFDLAQARRLPATPGNGYEKGDRTACVNGFGFAYG